MRKINHFGIPTATEQANEFYAEGLKVHLTDYSSSPNKIEFLRFEEGSCMPELVQKVAHIAYEVPDLDAALKGAKVIVEPMRAGENLMIAFIEEEGIPVELMCFDNQ
jgi:predicted enzyme related to lactoylglutathione lyase